jgi:hypothetical protein
MNKFVFKSHERKCRYFIYCALFLFVLATDIKFIRSNLLTLTGLGIAEVPVLRLRQAFWLADVM